MQRLFAIALLIAAIITNSGYAAPSFGLRLGPGFSNASVSPDDGVKPGTRAGVIVGASLLSSVHSNNLWILRCDFLYSQKGWIQKGDVGDGTQLKVT